jgi:hypothetical protein
MQPTKATHATVKKLPNSYLQKFVKKSISQIGQIGQIGNAATKVNLNINNLDLKRKSKLKMRLKIQPLKT